MNPNLSEGCSIVFLHGVGEDSEGTWTKYGLNWPKDLLSKDVPESRIFLFGYESSIQFLTKEGFKTKIIAQDLCMQLKVTAKRSGIEIVSDIVPAPDLFCAY